MLASLVAGLASGETVAAFRRARRAAIVYFLAGVLGLAGIGFLTGALYIWLAAKYGSLPTALLFGVFFIAMALLVLLFNWLTAGSRARKASQQRRSDLAAVGVAAGLAVLPGLLRRPLGVGALLMPAVALVAYAIYRENKGRGADDPPQERPLP